MKKMKYNSILNMSLSFFLTLGLIFGFILIWGTKYYTLSALTASGVVDGSYYVVSSLIDDVPSWFKYLLYIYFFSIFIVVFIVFMSGMHRNLPIIYIASYLGMCVYSAILLLFISQDPIPYISSLSPMLSKMAPGTIMGIGLFFLAANEKKWFLVQNSLFLLIIISVLLSLYGIIKMEHALRWHAQRWVWAPGLILEILCFLPIAIYQNKSFLMKLLSHVTIVVLPILGLLQQTRLVFVMLIIQVICYNFIRFRSATSSKLQIMVKLCSLMSVIAILVLFISFFSKDYYSDINKTIVSQSSHSFIERITNKERLKQIEPFFDIFWEKFPFGAGYPAKGEINGESDMRNGIDSGYLNTTYICGVPMILCFIIMMVVPVVRSLFLRLEAIDTAVVAGAFAYCIRLTSSSIPNFQIDFIIFVLLAGRCAYLVSKKNEVDGLSSTQ